MSASDSITACELSSHRVSALIMAAMMAGRQDQEARLRSVFREIGDELDQRSQSPDGRTSSERVFDELERER